MDWRTITAQFAAWPVRFPCLRVWPDRDHFSQGKHAPAIGAMNLPLAIRETTTMATPYPGNVTPLVPAVTRRAAPVIRTIQPVRSRRRAASRLGGFQGGAKPRHHPLRDLSGARTGAGATGAGLFGVAAAVSARGRFCPARPVRGTRPLRTELSARTRRRGVGLACDRGAALAVVRRHARARHAAAGAVRDLGRHRAGDLRRDLRL